MRLILDCAKLLAYCALIVLLGEAAWAIHRLRPKAEVIAANLDRTVIIAGAAAGNLERSSKAWEQASKEQSTQTSLAMSRVSAAAGQLSGFITNTDKSVNASLLPAMTEAIRSQNAALLTNQQELTGDLRHLAETTTQLQKVLADADHTISGPELKETLQNTADATKNAVVVTQNLAATTADVREGVHYEVRQLEAPVTKFKAVFNIALTVLRKLFF